jgi:hypothetical protein
MKDRRKKLTRRDDPMEVGLARYEKERPLLPVWVVEHGGKIVLGAFFLFVSIPLFLLRDSTSEKNTDPLLAAELILMNSPSIVWESGRDDVINRVSVLVGNKALVGAKGVEIIARIGERRYSLQGDGLIPSGESREYARELRIPHNPKLQLNFELHCDNCPE